MAKTIKFFFTILFIFSFLFSVSSQNIDNTHEYFINSYMYVTAGNGLNLRAEPTVQSMLLQTLPFLSVVRVIELSENLVVIDGISSQWYIVEANNNIGWVFGGYLSINIEIPMVNNLEFFAVYRINNINVNTGSFGYEDLIFRLRKSYLVIYESSGNRRYIYDNEGLIEIVPRFGDSQFGSDIIVSGVYRYPWSPGNDNSELTDQILITFQSNRWNKNNEAIYDYYISVTYERVEL